MGRTPNTLFPAVCDPCTSLPTSLRELAPVLAGGTVPWVATALATRQTSAANAGAADEAHLLRLTSSARGSAAPDRSVPSRTLQVPALLSLLPFSFGERPAESHPHSPPPQSKPMSKKGPVDAEHDCTD